MRLNLKIPFIGALIFLTISVSAEKDNKQHFVRPKRSFGFSNPIFSRVFNPYDDRPLSEKFFGHSYVPRAQEDGPQHYSLWSSQPDLEETPGYSPPRSRTPYPEAWKHNPELSKPYPPSKPYPQPLKPYPEASKPSKPFPDSTKPCPDPTKPKPYPASQQTSWKPVIGRLFVDEVDKNLRFEQDPETGMLVPVITDGKKSTQPQIQTTTVKTISERITEREYDFKLLPNYDIKTRFNNCFICSSTQKTPTKSPEVEKLEEYNKILQTLRLEQLQKKFEEKKRKLMDEVKWPPNSLQTLIEEHKKSKKDCKKNNTRQISSTIRPIFIVPNEEINNKYFERETTKKPCHNKTIPGGSPLIQIGTEKPPTFNVRVRISDGTKRILPHNTREDYTQFLAPPGYVKYQKFNDDSSPKPPTFTDRKSPSRGLEFRVFNEKLDQRTLDSLRNSETGELDPSKLEEITHTVVVEPVKRRRPNKFYTLDSPYKTINVDKFQAENNDKYESYEVPLEEYGLPSSIFGKHRINKRPSVF